MVDPMRFPAPPAGGPPRRSPLGPLTERLGIVSGQLYLSEAPFPGQLLIHGDGTDPAFALAVELIIGLPPPLEVGEVAACPNADILTTGPGRWLAVVPGGREEVLLRALRQRLDGLPAAIADVTDAWCVIDLAGPAAREVLTAGCPLDLHPIALPPGRCASSLLAGQPVIVQALDSGAAQAARVAGPLRLFIPASRARWLVGWILDLAGGL